MLDLNLISFGKHNANSIYSYLISIYINAFAQVCFDVTLCEAWSSIHLQACRCFTFLIRIQQSRLKFSALLIIVFANAKTIMSRGQAARLPDPAGKLVWLKAKVHPNDF